MIRMFLLSSVVMLISCTIITKPPLMLTNEEKACKRSCQVQREYCGKICRDSCLQCTRHAYHHAVKRYARYKHEQCVRGEYVMRELQSYADPLKCTKTTCECPAEYAVCIQACDGKIRKRLQVAPVCKGC